MPIQGFILGSSVTKGEVGRQVLARLRQMRFLTNHHLLTFLPQMSSTFKDSESLFRQPNIDLTVTCKKQFSGANFALGITYSAANSEHIFCGQDKDGHKWVVCILGEMWGFESVFQNHVVPLFMDKTNLAEVFLALFFQAKGDFQQRIKKVFAHLKGPYSFVLYSSGGLTIAGKSPESIWPIYYYSQRGVTFVASEGAILPIPAIEVQANKVLIISTPGETPEVLIDSRAKCKICIHKLFWGYLTNTVINSTEVGQIRHFIGEIFFASNKSVLDALDLQVLVPLPMSAFDFVGGIRDKSGIKVQPALTRASGLGASALSQVLAPSTYALINELSYTVKGFLIKDKIVGLVMSMVLTGGLGERLARQLIQAGAKKVHLLICAPRVFQTCVKGHTLPDNGKLAAGTDLKSNYISSVTYLPFAQLKVIKNKYELSKLSCVDCFSQL